MVKRKKPERLVQLVEPKHVPATNGDIRAVLSTIATVLEAPRDRFGRLEFYQATPEQIQARETIRLFAIKHKVGGAKDVLEQCALVARAVLKR